jgi:aarF domain-containing kinase
MFRSGAFNQVRFARTLPRRRPPQTARNVAIAVTAVVVLYNTNDPFRHSVLASVRCARLMRAVVLDVIDYKIMFARQDGLELQEQRQQRRECHLRSANRLLQALKKNSGIYVKLGQHVAAVQVLPPEWTQTMTPLQDQCFPTDIKDTDAMLRADLGVGIDDLFTEFDPHPIGVASLAQVHRAVNKDGQVVAVKVQHADLLEFAKIDMATVNFSIHLVRYLFPEFEFSWLADEMNDMLPLELDFTHEAANSLKCRQQFAHLTGKTSLYLPKVMWAEKRCMVMEYIQGARVDNLEYLQQHGIDRNQVSQELSRIFSQMVYLNGFFHADPHHGNLLIRPRAPRSNSPYNFDVCLLDHGQYFDVPDDLRIHYARFWLSLIKPSSAKTTAERKHYAKLVGNINDEMVSLGRPR